MTAAGAHRGPDGEGYWFQATGSSAGRFTNSLTAFAGDATVALGHRRLAILDLSSAGIQPMASSDRQHWLVFNGEIYNHSELRATLKQARHRFHSATDTEVVLAAYREWGTDCFERFNGMWGLAILDLVRGSLILSRDRLGIKPLYVAQANDALLFASEIKQLLASSRVKAVGNREAIVEYIDTGYQTEPLTMFSGIESFEAGCFSEISLARPQRPHPVRFWRPPTPRRSRAADPRAIAEEFRGLFDDAVSLQLRADVPVGISLSGGLDSSALYGQARQGGSNELDLFSAAFDGPAFDERPFMKHVTDRYGGRLHLAFPDAAGFIRDCDRFVYHHDEPVGSLSQYAAWSVMERTRATDVKVLLIGQGADELFSGYWPAYYMFLRQRPLTAASHVLGSLLPGGNAALLSQMIPHLRQYYSRLNRRNRDILTPEWRALAGTRPDNWAQHAQQLNPAGYRLAEIRDIHLPRLLRWDDRSSMAFSIEGRYPYLDHRLVEFALAIPPEMNFHRGWTKMLMRNALGDVLPPQIQWRRSKNGFVTPQSEWLRTSLRPVFAEWLARPSSALGEIVDIARLRTFADGVLRSRADSMDERQFLLVRLFLLDRWLSVFGVAIPSGLSAPLSKTSEGLRRHGERAMLAAAPISDIASIMTG